MVVFSFSAAKYCRDSSREENVQLDYLVCYCLVYMIRTCSQRNHLPYLLFWCKFIKPFLEASIASMEAPVEAVEASVEAVEASVEGGSFR